MTDLATMIEIVAYTALVTAPVVLLARLLAGNDGPTLSEILGAQLDPPWPRGVQEEEPIAWRPERLSRRSGLAEPDRGDCNPVGLTYPRTARPDRIA